MSATIIHTSTNRLINGNFSTNRLEPWTVSAERHHTIRKNDDDEGKFIRLLPGTTLAQSIKGITRPVRASFKVRAPKVAASEFAFGVALLFMGGENTGKPEIREVRATSEWESKEYVFELPGFDVIECNFAVSCMGPVKPTDNPENPESELVIGSMDYSDFKLEYLI
jgi:hypothetical protein